MIHHNSEVRRTPQISVCIFTKYPVMSNDNQASHIAIIVAVIGVVGTLGGALFANWDNVEIFDQEGYEVGEAELALDGEVLFWRIAMADLNRNRCG